MNFPDILKLRITSGSIASGKIKSKCFCPIANAIKKKFNLGIFSVSVDDKDIFIKDKEQIVKYAHSTRSSLFVRQFDKNPRIAKPITFILNKEKNV